MLIFIHIHIWGLVEVSPCWHKSGRHGVRGSALTTGPGSPSIDATIWGAGPRAKSRGNATAAAALWAADRAHTHTHTNSHSVSYWFLIHPGGAAAQTPNIGTAICYSTMNVISKRMDCSVSQLGLIEGVVALIYWHFPLLQCDGCCYFIQWQKESFNRKCPLSKLWTKFTRDLNVDIKAYLKTLDTSILILVQTR